MTLNELKKIVDLRVAQGDGDMLVVTGDCNGYVKASVEGTGGAAVEDLKEYIMESCDLEDGYPVFVIGE